MLSVLSAVELTRTAISYPIVLAEWLDETKMPTVGPPEAWACMLVEFEGISDPVIISKATIMSLGPEKWFTLWGRGVKIHSLDEAKKLEAETNRTGFNLPNDNPSCPSCGFINWESLGILGRLHWARCRSCGQITVTSVSNAGVPDAVEE